LPWATISETDLIPAGHQIGEAELLFKIEDEEIQKQIDKLEATKVANKAENKLVEPQKKRFSLMILQNGYACWYDYRSFENAESK
jgi:hypothetical protein